MTLLEYGEDASVASRILKLIQTVRFSETEMDVRELVPHVVTAKEGLLKSFLLIKDPYYSGAESLSSLLAHGDLLANFLVRLSWSLADSGLAQLADDVASLNKALNGLDFFPRLKIPSVFMLVHPLGTVVGKSELHDFSVVYQRVSIGASGPSEVENEYPVFDGPVVLFSGSTVLGRSRVGENVVFGANSSVINVDVPPDTVVVGQFPRHRFLPGGNKMINQYFLLGEI